MKTYDFLSIGDTVTDAFIRLKDASVHCKLNKEDCELCMTFGDKIPYENVTVIPAVGNSANAAVSAARLGLKSALVTNLGADMYGKDALKYLKSQKVGTEFIKVNKKLKTNYHYVLWFEDDRTILVKHEKYPYSLPKLGKQKWIYLSSLGADANAMYPQLKAYLEANQDVKLVFQPGTYQMSGNVLEISYFYKRSEIFFCNKEESQRILKSEDHDIKNLLKNMRSLGPKMIVITDGPKGSYVYDGETYWQMPIYPDPKPPFERTGAGDAFSSTFTSVIALGRSIEEALMWASINSMSVVQKVGAQAGLLTRKELEEYLKNAPADYKPRKI